ncbi:MAG: ribonuclease P protein component [Candidatus Andersenbacteria bacterium]|nr:ribonuclease P protein component [Candidatus Andersenbacteria bacterium]
MLSGKHRLRKSADILAVLRTGRKFRLKGLKVCIKPSPQQPVSRAACVVGKTVSPLSVRRHRYQRWLRVLAREIITSQPDVVDIVMVAQAGIEDYQDLASLRQTLTKTLSL